uniref:Uncharacterized protein n=1 Tax=Anguilla anguilla TaxID=7936 RepID=A0A0E9PNQ0_ANGAN
MTRAFAIKMFFNVVVYSLEARLALPYVSHFACVSEYPAVGYIEQATLIRCFYWQKL